MATIRKRNGKWQAQIRRQGAKAVSRTFLKRVDAETWARHQETEADRTGLPADVKQLRTLTLGDLIRRFLDTVAPNDREHLTERVVLDAFLSRSKLGEQSLTAIGPSDFASYRDARLKLVKPA